MTLFFMLATPFFQHLRIANHGVICFWCFLGKNNTIWAKSRLFYPTMYLCGDNVSLFWNNIYAVGPVIWKASKTRKESKVFYSSQYNSVFIKRTLLCLFQGKKKSYMQLFRSFHPYLKWWQLCYPVLFAHATWSSHN